MFIQSINGLKLDFESPLAWLLNFRASALRTLANLEADAKRTAQSLHSHKNTPASDTQTLTRLQNILQAQNFNHQKLSKMFQPLIEHPALPHALGSFTGAPSLQTESLEANFVNLFRDWAWPYVSATEGQATEETRAHLKAILDLLPDRKMTRVLILGAGSARLAFDLACEIKCDEIVATEINPLLFLAAKEILDGKTLDLYEIAELPASLETASVKQSLKLPTDVQMKSKLTLLFNDFTEDRLQEAQFDIVITPWFIDVVGLPFEITRSKINRLLTVGGSWVNLGPLMFMTNDRSELLTNDEIQSRLSQSNSGFRVERKSQNWLTQLKSSLSATFRTDAVYGWRADKIENQKTEQVLDTNQTTAPRAEFIQDTGKPVVLERLLPNLDLEEAAQSHALLSEILMACHEGQSVRQMATKLAPDFGLPAEAVEPIVQGVLVNFIRSQS